MRRIKRQLRSETRDRVSEYTLLRPTTTEGSMGDTEETYTDIGTVPLNIYNVQSATLQTDRGEIWTTECSATYLPDEGASTDPIPQENDRITWNGSEYEILGIDPAPADDELSVSEVKLVRVDN